MGRKKIKTVICGCCGNRVSPRILKKIKGLTHNGEPATACFKCHSISDEEHERAFIKEFGNV